MLSLLAFHDPCQPFSVAGKQEGENDERNMWPETAYILSILRPRYALLENVPGLLAHQYFGRILGDLVESGFNIKWRVLSAAEMGAPHKRDRVWIVADAQREGLQERQLQQGIQRKAGCYDNGENTSMGAWWATEPGLDRLANGTPNRVGRIRAAGNSQVPAVVAAAWNLLNDC